MAFTRQEWNDLVDEVNLILEGPPEGNCDPVAPLEHVPESHRWAKSDIREMQDRIKETCPDIVFDEIPDLWEQQTIDEIRDKLGMAWCDCDCDDLEFLPCDFGTLTEVNIGISVDYEHLVEFGNTGIFIKQYSAFNYGPVLNGMQVAQPGYRDRYWTLYRKTTFTDGTFGYSENQFTFNAPNRGRVECDGTIIYVDDTSGIDGGRFSSTESETFVLVLWCPTSLALGGPRQRRCCEDDEPPVDTEG